MELKDLAERLSLADIEIFVRESAKRAKKVSGGNSELLWIKREILNPFCF